jgi:hypothetical protein
MGISHELYSFSVVSVQNVINISVSKDGQTIDAGFSNQNA